MKAVVIMVSEKLILLFLVCVVQSNMHATTSQCATTGENITLTCQVKGPKTTTTRMTWKRVIHNTSVVLTSNERINPSQDYIHRLSVVGNHTTGDYRLQIRNLTTDDEGNYTCETQIKDHLLEEHIRLRIKDTKTNISCLQEDVLLTGSTPIPLETTMFLETGSTKDITTREFIVYVILGIVVIVLMVMFPALVFMIVKGRFSKHRLLVSLENVLGYSVENLNGQSQERCPIETNHTMNENVSNEIETISKKQDGEHFSYISVQPPIHNEDYLHPYVTLRQSNKDVNDYDKPVPESKNHTGITTQITTLNPNKICQYDNPVSLMEQQTMDRTGRIAFVPNEIQQYDNPIPVSEAHIKDSSKSTDLGPKIMYDKPVPILDTKTEDSTESIAIVPNKSIPQNRTPDTLYDKPVPVLVTQI